MSETTKHRSRPGIATQRSGADADTSRASASEDDTPRESTAERESAEAVDLDGQPGIPRIRRYATEFIGTFFLVFVIGSSVLTAAPLAPLAIGSSLMVMVFAGGHISGAHFNPAVTLGVWLRGRIDAVEVLPYWLAQAAGALAAALVAGYVTGKSPTASDVAAFWPAAIVEFLMTFALVWVVLNVATAKNNLGNGFYGLAIGFTVLAGAVAVGGISGGAFNPAVGLGVTVMGLATWSTAGLYLVADLLGGAAAALAFRALNSHDK